MKSKELRKILAHENEESQEDLAEVMRHFVFYNLHSLRIA